MSAMQLIYLCCNVGENMGMLCTLYRSVAWYLKGSEVGCCNHEINTMWLPVYFYYMKTPLHKLYAQTMFNGLCTYQHNRHNAWRVTYTMYRRNGENKIGTVLQSYNLVRSKLEMCSATLTVQHEVGECILWHVLCRWMRECIIISAQRANPCRRYIDDTETRLNDKCGAFIKNNNN